MRNILILLCLVSGLSYAQETIYTVNPGEKPANVIPRAEQYRFSDFIKGTVLFKDGSKSAARMNYNSLFREMLFIDPKGDTLAISNPEQVKEIRIEDKVYYYDQAYLEKKTVAGNRMLAEKVFFVFSDTKKEGPMGKSTNTVAVEAMKVDQSRTMHRFNFVANDFFTLQKRKEIYLADDQMKFVLANRKNLSKIIGSKNLKEYLSHSSINFNSLEDLEKVLKYFATGQAEPGLPGQKS